MDEVTVDAVLAAVGRVPAVGVLNLEAAGVATDERGFIIVDDQLRTTVEGIYAVGDVHGGAQFTTPPLAAVGITETEAQQQGLTYRVAAKKIAAIPVMPRPKILGNPAGMAKCIINADTDLILGAVLYCVDAQELINMVALAMRAGVTASQLRDGIWTHPSSTEVLNRVL